MKHLVKRIVRKARIPLWVLFASLGMVLATVAIFSVASYVGARERDSQRVRDLERLQSAMESYYDRHGTYMVAGAGWDALGYGWVGAERWERYTRRSIARVLYDEGLLDSPLVDGPSTIGSLSFEYMLYLCAPNGDQAISPPLATRYALFATKEAPSRDDLAKAANECMGRSAAIRFGKNFAVSGKRF